MDPTDNTVAAEASGSNLLSHDDPTNNTVAAKASGSKLLPHDDKDLKKVSLYAGSYEEKMRNLSAGFAKKGYLKLMWDRKVPKKDKRFYYFFTLKRSNREEVLADIKKYIDFYKEMGDIVQKVRQYEEEEEQQNSEINPYVIIHDLKMKLKDLYKAAEVDQDSTSSSTVYNLHKSFIEKHEELENMIKRVECISFKSGMVKAIDGWQNSIKEVEELKIDMKEGMKKYDDVCDKLAKFKLETEKQNKKMQVLLESNKEMKQQQEILVEVIQRMSKQQETMMEDNASMTTLLKSYMSRSSYSGQNHSD